MEGALSERLFLQTDDLLMFNVLQLGIDMVERGYVPDAITRSVIRRLCAQTANAVAGARELENSHQFIESLKIQPIAVLTDKANEQHYELPAEFFSLFLGHRRKYSCCYFEQPTDSLDKAEESALTRTCENAELEEGQTILELGCGWGSLSLWMAERYPSSQIISVSNSHSQRIYIEQRAKVRSLSNLQVITWDINSFEPPLKCDRVVSVEMFEHLRNFDSMLKRIAGWMYVDGKVLVHHFCHRRIAYPFETEGTENWMGRYFFTGGIMPCEDLLSRFSDDLVVKRKWLWNGDHYRRTADAWLALLDKHRSEAIGILTRTYGARHAYRWLQRWRMFLLAVSELFGFQSGNEWYVAHLLLEPAKMKKPSSVPVISSVGVQNS